MKSKDSKHGISPLDEHNEKLLENVHPQNWKPRTPEPLYNMVVIGAGAGGLISSISCASLGGKVALVERDLMGGDCLNVGCVPSKCIISSSRLAFGMASAQGRGLTPKAVESADFPSVMKRMRRIRSEISRNDSVERYEKMGVQVFLGEAEFIDRQSVKVGDSVLRFKKAVIATGARAALPDIPGLENAGYLTNENVFNLEKLPKRLAVIGGGPIGCELAQAFSRLGSEVTIIQRSRFLPREDDDASALLARIFEREGIKVLLGTKTERVEKRNGSKVMKLMTADGDQEFEVDEILIGAGRRPNVEGLNLEGAGVEYDQRKGVVVDDFLRTSNPDIYAAGDICMNWKFTHAADAAARIVVQNALFKGRKRLSALTMPWCTYTDPEIAHVGLCQKDAKSAGIPIDSYKVKMSEVDRAIVDGETDGFVRIVVKKGTDKILGATIMASHAGDLISEISVAMAGKVGLKTIADVIHPYPTQAEAIRKVAAAFNKTRLTPRVAAFFRWWLKRQCRSR